MTGDAAHERAAREIWLARLRGGQPGVLTVLSGSMAPLLRPGDRLSVAPAPRRLRPGLLVVFAERDRLTCHRLLWLRGRGRWWQKGDANAAWGSLSVADVIGRAVAVGSGDRSYRLDGAAFEIWNAALWLLVMARDLARLGGRLLPPAGSLAERVLSRLIAGAARRIRPERRDTLDAPGGAA